uniref:Ragulator complex protein LAMTOR1 n=1 Tax=Strigamia maritima TaxID=126957 RepID=T1JL32_STRMM
TGNPNERTSLLSNVQDFPSGNHFDEHSDSGRSTLPNQKCDEQSALNRILQETATNIIDVTAIDSHNLEQHEYMDRAQHYNRKLTSASVNSIYNQKAPCLLIDVPGPERILTADLTTMADLQMIIHAADKAAKAMGDVKVDQKDDLVVHYGIP